VVLWKLVDRLSCSLPCSYATGGVRRTHALPHPKCPAAAIVLHRMQGPSSMGQQLVLPTTDPHPGGEDVADSCPADGPLTELCRLPLL